MAKRILRGDATAVAQVSKVSCNATGLVSLRVNGKAGVAREDWDAAAIAAAWNTSTLPEFREVSAVADGDDVILTARTAGVPFEIEGLINGDATADEEQLITISPAATGGTFPLTYDGQTTGGIAYNATAAAVRSALEALSNIAPGDIEVTGPAGGPWRVRFIGPKADVDQPQLVTSRANLTGGTAGVVIETLQQGAGSGDNPLAIIEAVPGVAGTNAKWRIRLPYEPPKPLADVVLRWQISYEFGGDDFMNFSEYFSAAATLDEMRTKLGATRSGNGAATYGADNLSLSGTLAGSWSDTEGGILVEWINAWASTPLRQSGELSMDPDVDEVVWLTPEDIIETEVSAGVAGTNEIQGLQLVGSPAGDGFRLQIGEVITGLISWSAGAAGILGAINAALGGSYVRLPSSGPYQTNIGDLLADETLYFEFMAAGLQSIDLDAMTVVGYGAEEIQRIALTNTPWKGQVTLTLESQTAAALDWDSTAGEVEDALEALSNVGAGLVTCTGGPWPSTPIICTFDDSLGNLDQMTAVHTLTNADIAVATVQDGGAAITVEELQRSRGPLHWDDPTNWDDDIGAPGVPGSGDTVTLDIGATDLLFGLRQRSQFTVNASTDVLTLATGRATFAEGQALSVRSDTTLPAGLSDATTYYAVNVIGDTLQLAATPGGDPVDITTAGSGLHEIGVLFADLFIDSTFAKSLGLPRWHRSGYDEYRPQFLEAWAARIEIGAGQGSGSSRVKLDTGDVATTIEVVQTGGSVESGVPAFLWRGEHADNTLENIAGDVGVALFPDDAAQLAKLTLRGGNTVLGRAAEIADIRRTGGTLTSLGASVDGTVVL